MKNKENNYGKPFYLKAPKSGIKNLIFMGLIMLVLVLSSPYLVIIVPVYVVYAFIVIRGINSEAGKRLSSSIYYYNLKDYIKSHQEVKRVLELEPANKKALIIKALLEYNNENFEEFITSMHKVPKSIVSNDLDLQLKLGEALEKMQQYSSAKEIYLRLHRIFPKSTYINDALKRADLAVDNEIM